VRCTVAKISEEGADDHIDKLAYDYTGPERYQWRQPGDKHIICYIEPARVQAHG
jgi:hypothetical protein